MKDAKVMYAVSVLFDRDCSLYGIGIGYYYSFLIRGLNQSTVYCQLSQMSIAFNEINIM
jgi:hypothetical protein